MAGETAELERVREGVFFEVPEALPRGRHTLSRQQVAATQRERMLVAATELLAALGYRGFGPGNVARRAGVSLAAFYDCFDNKDDCLFAGYDRAIQVLLERMAALDLEGKEPPELVRALVGAYLDTLQSDLVVARAYQVEIDALGAPARRRRRESLTLFATFMRDVATKVDPRIDLPWSAYLGVVHATRQLATDALDAEPEPDLVALGDDLRIWFEDLFRRR